MRKRSNFLLFVKFFFIIHIFIFWGVFGSINLSDQLFNKLKYVEAPFSSRKMNEYPIEYTIIDHYANGEDIIRGKMDSLHKDVNSLSNKMRSDFSHPLSKDHVALLGSEDFGFTINQLVESDYSPYLRQNIGAIYRRYNENMSESPQFGAALNDYIAEGGPDIVVEVATGDFDGNFREDIISVSRVSQKLSIQIQEMWGNGYFQIMTTNANSVMFDCEINPTVTSGDIDGDNIDEFLILGTNQSQPYIWIFEDLVNSNSSNGLILYGDKIILKSFQEVNSYVTSGVDSMHCTQITTDFAPNETEFTILNAYALNWTGPLQYGDEVVLRDHENCYWSVNEQSDLLELILKSDPSDIEEKNKFVLVNDNNPNQTGNVYYNNFISFKDSRGKFVRSPQVASSSYDIALSEALGSWQWYKIIPSNDKLPHSFLNDLIPLDTLSDEEYSRIDMLSRPSSSNYDYHIASKSITTGNVDGDENDEIIIAGMDPLGRARAWIFDDRFNKFAKIHEFIWEDQIVDINFCIATGNIDKDSQTEIIFLLSNNTFGQVEIYDDGFSPRNYPHLKSIESSEDNFCGLVTRLKTGDIDADGLDEIILVNGSCWIHVWDDILTNFSLIDNWSVPDSLIMESLISFYHNAYGLDFSNLINNIPIDLVCGDVDRDGSEEVFLALFKTKTANLMDGSISLWTTWELNGSSFSYMNVDSPFIEAFFSVLFDIVQPSIPFGDMSTVARVPKISFGDYNADCFSLKYIDHKVYSTNEQVFAVMAAPPTQADISQNYDESNTNYGQGVSSSSSEFYGGQTSFGGYIGLDIDISCGAVINVKIGSFEVEGALIFEFTYTYTLVSTTTRISSYSGDYSSDYVIFSSCSYDRYIYEIIDCPDVRAVGLNYSIHIPNTPETYKWDREYYNSHNSLLAKDIGSETYNHTIGYIPSYPSNEEMKKIAPKRSETDAMQVGKGQGSNTVEIDFSKEASHDFEFELNFQGRIGVEFVGLTGGWMGSIGGHGGFSIGWGHETMFSGTVGDIKNANDYANFRYKFALCVYKKYIYDSSLIEEAKELLTELFGFDPTDEFSPFNYDPDNQIWDPRENKSLLQTPPDVRKIENAFKSLKGFNKLLLGDPYYVIDYWVEIPEFWGSDGQQVVDYASDLEELINNFNTPGWSFFSLIAIVIPAIYKILKRDKHF